MNRIKRRVRSSSPSITANQSWSPDNVIVDACGPTDGTFISKDSSIEVLEGYHQWRNNNTEGSPMHAYVEAEVVIDGQAVPITVNEQHDYRRQENDTTYAVLIGGEGATHAVPFAIDVADLPVGENMSYGARIVTGPEPRGLIGF